MKYTRIEIFIYNLTYRLNMAYFLKKNKYILNFYYIIFIIYFYLYLFFIFIFIFLFIFIFTFIYFYLLRYG